MSAAIQKSRHALAAANIKKELTTAFPGIRFSVRSKSFSGGDSVDVAWKLGPTGAEVDAIINKYQDGDFDGMDDSYNYRKEGKDFRALNGSAKYVHGQRSLPDGLFERICRDIATLQGVAFTSTWQRRENDSLGLDDYARRVLACTSFPADAEYLGVAWGWELTLTGSCASGDSIRIIHTQTDEEAEMRQVIRREFERIGPRQPQRCGIKVLGPDDLILPCVLSSGHGGFCDTGR